MMNQKRLFIYIVLMNTLDKREKYYYQVLEDMTDKSFSANHLKDVGEFGEKFLPHVERLLAIKQSIVEN